MKNEYLTHVKTLWMRINSYNFHNHQFMQWTTFIEIYAQLFHKVDHPIIFPNSWSNVRINPDDTCCNACCSSSVDKPLYIVRYTETNFLSKWWSRVIFAKSFLREMTLHNSFISTGRWYWMLRWIVGFMLRPLRTRVASGTSPSMKNIFWLLKMKLYCFYLSTRSHNVV